jgi:hypothetical protein
MIIHLPIHAPKAGKEHDLTAISCAPTRSATDGAGVVGL